MVTLACGSRSDVSWGLGEAPSPTEVSWREEDEVCAASATRPSRVVCGQNQRGVFREECQGDGWVLSWQCDDPDECQDGAVTPSPACAEGEKSFFRCLQGKWSEGPCFSPAPQTAECLEGAVEATDQACGQNARGLTARQCRQGKWLTEDVCMDPDECADGASRPTLLPCGFAGEVQEECVFGSWTAGECLDSAECTEGQSEPGEPCSGGGEELRICRGGRWLSGGQCEECGEPFPDKNVDVVSNAQLEALRGISWFPGRLRIGGGVDSLQALSELRCVGELEVAYSQLTTLDGLEQLRKAQIIRLDSNDSLGSVAALAGLEWVFQHLTFSRLPALTEGPDLRGFMARVVFFRVPALTRLGDFESLEAAHFRLAELEAPHLTSLGGLEGMKVTTLELSLPKETDDLSALAHVRDVVELSVEGAALATDIPPLVELSRLRTLELSFVGIRDLDAVADLERLRSLRVLYCDALESAEGANSLRSLVELQFYDNGALRELGSFEHLTELESLDLRFNSALREISAFPVLRRANFLNVSFNPQLTAIEFPGLVRVDTSLELSENGALTSVRLPLLRQAARLRIDRSPGLPTCQAEAIIAALVPIALPLKDDWDSSGTDDGATCD